jgi:predicted DNA-binding transcriptional regulator YafY
MLEAYEMMNMVELSDQNKQHIFFETRKPKGLENFNGLLHAIKSKKITNFIHHKYWEDIITYRTVHPLALKEARGRWYLLAVDEKDNRLKSFGLDRINDLDISKAKYRTKYDYNFNEMFNHSFGIISDEKIKIQAVRINLAFEQGQFVKNFPLHHSQKIISETNTEVLIQLHIRPTYDFIMEILSMGEEVTILSPQTLINEVKRITKKVYEKYV